MANLASTYRDQGRWKEAEELQAPWPTWHRRIGTKGGGRRRKSYKCG
ncbi:hypothetical protein CI238_13645 [Colletotrichum incanum]|uniref:Uncharacterized protein n=1 Tax=Colletotrichum incanum TaxID=1573173 RepID=A0A166N4N9_COLIC|nr:hypothetical protein CI238_13645 [Colletotrichum incanum]